MNLLALRYFHEVARSRTVSEAALRVRVSQPALSKMLKALESELGVQLFERSRQGMKLTEDGRRVALHAERIFLEEKNLQQSIKNPHAPLDGVLRIGASDNLAVHVLPAKIAEFRRSHPGLEIEIFAGTSTDIKEALLMDRCDLGIFFTPIRAGEPFDSGLLFETDFWVVASPGLLKAFKLKPTIDSLRKNSAPRIESRHADYQAKGFVAHFHSTRLGLTSTPVVQTNQHEVKKHLILEGVGYGLLTRHTVEAEVKSGRLIRVPTRERLEAPVFWCRRRGSIHRAGDRFLELFR